MTTLLFCGALFLLFYVIRFIVKTAQGFRLF